MLALALPALAHAQAYQCRAPAVRSVPKIAPDGPRRSLPVTGYTMALSWSPEFCKPRKDSRAHAVQCSGANGSFGLVVHGLWPESRQSWPQWCTPEAPLTPADIRAAMCMMPSERLVARQWFKHGSCMVNNPGAYLKITRILWQSLRIPDYDRISREEDLTAGRIRSAFADANPGIPESAIGVKLSPRGWLEEIRLCYAKTFRPARCNAARLGARNSTPAKIWRGL
ncbi:ribonuclease T2 family protein [Erythrobacter dokdonensis]|uniref:Ribonuclease T2 family protein n=1 Tax=Erythrobacter dokdonensis DSW-74 TaxID=1300349 RepID=A0A1A7BE92_9SPHN|nr:ribonuclease T [Erythrobacter dokdonensis]OBV10848.1 Ribonuclease T2 family protein [Erythrobacter dokdonensis DSW-74]